MISSEKLTALFARESLSSYLPYEAWDPASGIYIADHGPAVIFECLPKVGAGMETLQVLEALYAAGFLPSGTTIQVLLYASPNVEALLSLWRDARQRGDLFRQMAERRTEMLRRMDGADGEAPLRNFRLLFSVGLPVHPDQAPPEERVRRASEISAKIEGLLVSMRLYPRKLSAQGLIALLFELLNPDHPTERIPAWDPSLPIREQVIFADSPLRIEADRLILDRRVVKSFSVKQYPTEPAGTLNQVIGNAVKGIDQIATPFLLAFNAVLLDQDKDVRAVEQKAGLVTYQSVGFLARILPKIQEKKENFDLLLRGIGNGHRLIRGYLHLVLYGREEKALDLVSQQVHGLFRKNRFILQEDHFVTLPLFLASLPSGLAPEAERKLLRRGRTLLSSNGAVLSPVCADWKGTGSPGLLLVSRRGQMMLVDLFDSPGNYNAVVAAAPGSGKSFLVNELCLTYLAAGGRVWVIDIGRSYLKLCHLLGGDFIEFRPEKPPCLNIFSRIRNLEEEIDLLIPTVGQMASPSRPLSDLERSFVEKAIRQAHERRAAQTTITAVAEELNRMDDARAKDLATMLYPYTKGGRYGHFFEGEMKSLSESPFVVLELEELRSKGDLKGAVLLLLMYTIQTEMYEGDRSRRKLVMIDEAWDLLGEGNAAKFIEHGYRRFRKYGGGILTITQGVDDLARTSAGTAALASSDHLFLLRQKEESLMSLREKNLVMMDEALFRLLSTLHTLPGRYSEVYVRTPAGSGIGRLMVDRFTQLVYTTRAEEFARIEAYRKEGLSLVEAIERCLE
ncbi:type IV secretion system protein TraC [Candidatus Manganitrophus noduliformans]|nr:type IV secretion system protein TraC [Candidatus Manganitrophus noduliformans]